MLNITCTPTTKLKKNIINEIISLKNNHWKYNIKLQKKFFLENVKKKDLHIMLLINKKIIGYVCLRRAKCFIKKNKKNYLHFDTFIIEKKFRKKNYAQLLMRFTNKVIETLNTFSILYCNQNLIKFYKKFKWKITKISFQNSIKKHKKKTTMIFNY